MLFPRRWRRGRFHTGIGRSRETIPRGAARARRDRRRQRGNGDNSYAGDRRVAVDLSASGWRLALLLLREWSTEPDFARSDGSAGAGGSGPTHQIAV